jgi:signal transduction histidine kinase
LTNKNFLELAKILPEPAILVAGDGRIIAANPPFLRILNADDSFLQNQTIFEFSTTSKPKLQVYLNNCSRSRQVIIGAIDLCNNGGQPIEFRCEGAVLEPAKENSEAVIFLRLKPKESASSKFNILTQKIEQLNKEVVERQRAEMERERLYREAQEASRLKDEFLATVSHELRTPLNAILGWARMIRMGNLDAPTFEKALETIERNALSQAQLIEDLLDVSRIITGKLRLDVRPIDLTKVIAAAVDSVRPTAENKRVRLQMIIDPRADIISGDAERLQQVIWNLLSNAIKFTPKGGRVQIRLERVNSHVEIIVSDTGEGIEPEFLPYVFERFRQWDGTKSRQYGGLGLGLAIVRHLVELHGGSVHAYSGGAGKGSTFTIHLPMLIVRETQSDKDSLRRHPTAVEENGTFECPPKLKNLNILVVDDEPDARELLKVILEECDARVIPAANAAEAFETIEKTLPDVLISDIEMPNEDGYSLIGRVRALADEKIRKMPAIALTAHARTEDRLRALSAGFDSHISKPFEPVELIAVINGIVRRTR